MYRVKYQVHNTEEIAENGLTGCMSFSSAEKVAESFADIYDDVQIVPDADYATCRNCEYMIGEECDYHCGCEVDAEDTCYSWCDRNI